MRRFCSEAQHVTLLQVVWLVAGAIRQSDFERHALDGIEVTRRLVFHESIFLPKRTGNLVAYSASVNELVWFAHTILGKGKVSERTDEEKPHKQRFSRGRYEVRILDDDGSIEHFERRLEEQSWYRL